MTSIGTDALPADLARHRAYARVFQPGRLTFGFIDPLEGHGARRRGRHGKSDGRAAPESSEVQAAT